jgi:hypothetical protein
MVNRTVGNPVFVGNFVGSYDQLLVATITSCQCYLIRLAQGAIYELPRLRLTRAISRQRFSNGNCWEPETLGNADENVQTIAKYDFHHSFYLYWLAVIASLVDPIWQCSHCLYF